MSAADLLASAFESLPELRSQLERVTQSLEKQAASERVRAAIEDGLHPDHAYSSRQAAQFLGIEAASVPKVSRTLLPRVRSGRFLGIDILAYRGDVTAAEAKAYKEATRDRVRAAGAHASAQARPPARGRKRSSP